MRFLFYIWYVFVILSNLFLFYQFALLQKSDYKIFIINFTKKCIFFLEIMNFPSPFCKYFVVFKCKKSYFFNSVTKNGPHSAGSDWLAIWVHSIPVCLIYFKKNLDMLEIFVKEVYRDYYVSDKKNQHWHSWWPGMDSVPNHLLYQCPWRHMATPSHCQDWHSQCPGIGSNELSTRTFVVPRCRPRDKYTHC